MHVYGICNKSCNLCAIECYDDCNGIFLTGNHSGGLGSCFLSFFCIQWVHHIYMKMSLSHLKLAQYLVSLDFAVGHLY